MAMAKKRAAKKAAPKKTAKKRAAKKSAPKKTAAKKAAPKRAAKKAAKMTASAKRAKRKATAAQLAALAKGRANRALARRISAGFPDLEAPSGTGGRYSMRTLEEALGIKPKKPAKKAAKKATKKAAPKRARKTAKKRPARRRSPKKSAVASRRRKRTPSTSRQALRSARKTGRLPKGFQFQGENLEVAVRPHASGRVLKDGSPAECVKCGRIHTLEEHYSHRLMHGNRISQSTYKCSKGGKCEFRAIQKAKGKKKRSLMGKQYRAKKMALTEARTSPEKLARLLILQKKLEDAAKRSARK